MEIVIRTLLIIHIIAGFSSLILFWVPVITRKGSKVHRLVGKAYVWLMWVVVVTAALMSINNLLTGRPVIGAFLGFLSLITASPLWYGIAVLRQKQGISKRYRNFHLGFRIVLIVAALALIAYGIVLKGEGGAILLFIFGGLGLSDLPSLIQNIRKPSDKANWFKDHLVGMGTSGIAAYTAFLVFGANQFMTGIFIGTWIIVPWTAPTVIGLTAMRLAVRSYKKKGRIS